MKTAGLAAPPGFFRGFGPRCRAPRFRVRTLRHSKYSAERTSLSLITASHKNKLIDRFLFSKSILTCLSDSA